MQNKLLALAVALASTVPVGALASPPPEHHEPPPFAFEACSGKSVSDECTVEFGERDIDGSCVEHTDQRLFCLPSEMPPPAGQRPPPGARPY
jgi:hypothetical protein